MSRFAFATLALLLLPAAALSASETRPNIVFILADDLGYGDLSSFGQERFSTPNIDRLAEDGLTFTQHYSGSTVCAPSRSSLLTGQHTGHTPIRGNKEVQPEGQHPLPADIPTIPKLLRKAGYVTGMFGKWGLGFPGSEGDPMEHFDRFYGYNCQRIGHHYYPYHLWDDDRRVELPGNAGKDKGQYAPELIHKEALAFIEEHQDRPFFCYIPTVIPHAELAAPERYMERHRGRFDPGEPYVGYEDGPKFREGPYQSQAEPHVAHAAMMSVLDDQVGEIVAKLQELGIAENTLIVFTSDNGPHFEGGGNPDFFDNSGPFEGRKRDLYEGGIRVPMIVRWPEEVARGTRSDHVSAFWDFLPTLTDILDVEAPERIDGISFLPTLLGSPEEQRQHEYLYWEFHEQGGRIAIRQDNWKAVKYDYLEHPDRPAELYDLVSDPGEETNLAALYPDVRQRLEELMEGARVPSDIFTFSSVQYQGEAREEE